MLAPEVRPRSEALELVRRSVASTDRVVVTGASGWFGRTMLALLWHAFGREWVERHVLASASVSRQLEVLGCGRVEVREVQTPTVEAFAPTLLVNCAFPTKNRVSEMGIQAYLRTARGLTKSLLAWAALPSVERVITMSSGAAVPSPRFPADIAINPYGVLKAQEEAALLQLAKAAGIAAQVCRVWAVSGPQVQHPANYALSDFILQALDTRRIVVRSTRPVLRSYASVDDVLALAMASLTGPSTLFDTGGSMLEVGDLASEVAGQCGGVPVVRKGYDPMATPDDYRADTSDWDRMCNEQSFTPAGLEEQVSAAIAGAAAWTR